MGLGKRVRDIALETLVGVAAVTALTLYAFNMPKGKSLDFRPIALIANTVLVFGFLISWFRYSLKNSLFWIVLAILLLGHLAAYFFILNRIQNLPYVAYGMIRAIELGLFTTILNKIPSKGPIVLNIKNRHSRSSFV